MDSKSALARRRQNSTAARSRGLSIRQAQPKPLIKIEPKSAYASDVFLQEFLNPAFDPAEYLNASLAPLQGAAPSRQPSAKTSVPLAELSTEAQTLLSQLNAHTTRLTSTLTQLTDDILRSGSRLAYEVELLRGETLSLAETLTEGLKDDVEKFVPGGISSAEAKTVATPMFLESPAAMHERRASLIMSPETIKDVETAPATDEPPYITHLRTLTLVRSRLDSVIKTFGDAMEFTFPPSELSVSSSFLSVSAPDPGKEAHSTEEKGRQVLQKLRDEISGLLARSNPDPIKGIEEAAKRIEDLKELANVWKGTAEEKGRAKFIEGLARMVEVELQASRKNGGGKVQEDSSSSSRRDNAASSEAAAAETKGLGGYGFINQLQKIRGGLQ